MNFSNDVHLTRETHFLLHFLLFLMQWQKWNRLKESISYVCPPPPYIFPITPCYKVVLTELYITTLEKWHSLSFKIQNILKFILVLFYSTGKTLLWKRCLFLSTNILNAARKFNMSPSVIHHSGKGKNSKIHATHKKVGSFTAFVCAFYQIRDGLCILAMSFKISTIRSPFKLKTFFLVMKKQNFGLHFKHICLKTFLLLQSPFGNRQSEYFLWHSLPI